MKKIKFVCAKCGKELSSLTRLVIHNEKLHAQKSALLAPDFWKKKGC